MPIHKIDLLNIIRQQYDERKGAIRKRLNTRSFGMKKLFNIIDAFPDGDLSQKDLIKILNGIFGLSSWNRNTLTGEIANQMREHILCQLDTHLHRIFFLDNWTALSLGKGAAEDNFSIGFAKSLLARILTLVNKDEKEIFREEFIKILERNPNLRMAILSETTQHTHEIQQRAQRAIKNLLDGDPILATLVHKTFKRANKQLFEEHRQSWARRGLTNAEQIFSSLKTDTARNEFATHLLAQPLDPNMELDIVAADGKLCQTILTSVIPINESRHLYFQARNRQIHSQNDIKNTLGFSKISPNSIPAALAAVVLRVKSLWKQVEPSWWDNFRHLVGWESEHISTLRKNNPLFEIALDSPKNKLNSLYRAFCNSALSHPDRSVIAHHLCETLLAETTHANFTAWMTRTDLENQQLLAYALTVGRYRLILSLHHGVADLRELLPTSDLQTAINHMGDNVDPFIQSKIPPIREPLRTRVKPVIPGLSSAFMRCGLGAGRDTHPTVEQDEPAAGATADTASPHPQPAPASKNPHAPLLARSTHSR
ncbi:MAG: hypothetical protein A3C55_00320 [Gammaproteobacteria bacterium RIFCSPHIGHO2_02_FULL_42_13]|nr:MAG: hypothetical protein A3C55_00320 [Gammaproteobacteria bacterium RIFCSPHIGHO2_02_FULL_42_13]OGT68642.1 MAG: hypothetical protein A3H43_00725 [Gammaproteobacteria bacterium RIFCSPLOWO2_02_FULL_42_9]